MTERDFEATSRSAPAESLAETTSDPASEETLINPPGLRSWHWQRPDPLSSLRHKLPTGLLMRDQVGLDLGSRWVKYAVTRHGLGSPRVIAAGGVPVEVTGHGEMGKIRGQIAALMAIRAKIDHGTQRWVVGIGGQGTMVRSLEIPRLPRKELMPAILWQAQKKFPFPLEEAHVAVHYSKTAPTEPVKAVVAAATKRMVEDALFLLTEAEIKPATLTLPAFGLGGLLADANLRNPNDYYGLLDVGAESTLMAVYHGTSLVFYREIDQGTNAVATALAEDPGMPSQSVTDPQARMEELLFKHGVGDGLDAHEHGSHMAAPIGAALDRILLELQSTLEYYAAQSGGLKISQFLLLGGGASIPGLDAHLSAFLETPVHIHASLSQIPQMQTGSAVAPLASPSWASAYGYSLLPRKVSNLLPPEYQRAQEMQFKRMLWRTSTGTAVAISLLLAGAEMIRGDRAANRLDLMNQQVTQTEQQLDALGLTNVDATLAANRRWLSAVTRDDVNAAALLRTIADVTPAKIVLDHLDVRPLDSGWVHVTLNGEVRTQHEQNEVALAAFIENLEATGWLTEVSLDHYVTQRRPAYEQILFTVSMRAPLEGSRL